MKSGGRLAGSGGAGGGTAVALAGAASVNVTVNDTSAYIASGSDVSTTTSGDIRLSATDLSVISAIGGGLAGSGAGGAGGVLSGLLSLSSNAP